MKTKKGMIAQSIIMLVVSFSLLTVATFAWFSPRDVKISPFEVSVMGALNIETHYYRGSTANEVSAGTALNLGKLIPGASTDKIIITVKNIGKTSIKIKIALTKIAFTTPVGSEADIALFAPHMEINMTAPTAKKITFDRVFGGSLTLSEDTYEVGQVMTFEFVYSLNSAATTTAVTDVVVGGLSYFGS